MKSRKFVASFVVLIAYMGIIFYLSGLPGDFLYPERAYGFDIDQSIKHFVEFSILGILAANISWQLTKESTFNRGFVIFFGSSVFSALYGASDEIHQYFVPTRYCTTFDVLTDIAGSVTGVFVFLVFMRLINAKDRKVL